MTPPALVFDLDGTLIDSAPDIRAAANAVLGREGAAPLSLAETRSFVGAGAPTFVRRMMAARGLGETEYGRLLAAFLVHYERAVDLTSVFPGAVDALALLKARGHALGLCTNKPAGPTASVLSHLGLAERFEAVIGGDSLPVKKPDPAPLLAAFEGLPGVPGLYVGDSEIDAEAAHAAGVPFVLFTEGYRKAPAAELPHRATFDHWDKLPALVDAVLGRVA